MTKKILTQEQKEDIIYNEAAKYVIGINFPLNMTKIKLRQAFREGAKFAEELLKKQK